LARIIIALLALSAALFFFRNYNQQELNRRSIERAIEASQGVPSRPEVPFREPSNEPGNGGRER
jgi:hypothetical protein